MVILKFNKLIRNKWVWSVFALIVTIAFVAPNGCLYGSDSRRSAEAFNKLPKIDFNPGLYEQSDYLVRAGILDFVGLSRFFDESKVESVWKVYAALAAFDEAGLEVPDQVLAERIKVIPMFADPKTAKFDPQFYADAVNKNFRLTVHQFEQYFRLALKLEMGISAAISDQSRLCSAAMEQECYDFSDKFTVRVATFTEDKGAAEKVKVSPEQIGGYYNDNKASFAFPDRYKVRYVKLNPLASNLLAKVTVTDEQIKTRYEENKESGLYDVASTNDTVSVKPLEEVRDRIVVDLKNEAARASLEEEIASTMPEDSEKDKTVKFLDELAAKKNLTVKTSDWFAFGGNNNLSGFVKPVQFEFPNIDVAEFRDKVRNLSDTDLNIVSTANALWIFQSAGVSEAFEPEFDKTTKTFRVPRFDDDDETAEVKNETPAEKAAQAEFDKKMKALVGPKALESARAEAFKKTVESVIEKGADAVLKSANVSTNFVFQPCAFTKQRPFGWENRYNEWDFSKAGFPNASKIVPASRKLVKGGVSDFILLSKGRAAVVVCQDRVPGSAKDYEEGMEFARGIEMMSRYNTLSDLISKWLDWNLKFYGYADDSGSDASEDIDNPSK